MADSRPNIILFITDQQRFDTIRALGFPYMETPNLDRLIDEGVVFTNCHITAPSCVPSRASLFTGYYPHTTGILKNGDQWEHSWVENMATSGYYCVNVGKMHTVPFETPLGFHERFVVENKDRYLEGRYYFDEWDKGLRAKGLVKQQRESYRQRADYQQCMGAFTWDYPEETQSDMFVGDMATWWLNTKPKLDQPLFMEIGFPGPHPPYDPVPRFLEPCLDRDLPLPAVTDDEINAQPAPFQAMRQHNAEVDHDSIYYQLNPTQAQQHRQRAHYYANVTMIDEKIGQILSVLDDKGYLDNAVVIFTSDHGDSLGDHGHSQQWTMYDIITRVPTVIWSPNRFAGGRIVDGLCQMMDLGPTILELAGLNVPESYEAQSLLPALDGDRAWTGREVVFAEHGRDGILRETDFMTMVRTKAWKLVHFLDEPFGQLFDLVNDPNEKLNLWDNPDYVEQQQMLLALLREWQIRSAYQTRSWSAGWR
ncbi:MAG: DUF4976 domain-containing protein [Anaerolineales bacterium]|nr:MAG: DUF4976 domain-containing protein [Anaerolineales bacterium]